MAVTRDWVLYSGQLINPSAASATCELFQESESAATAGYQETNMPVAGQLPKEWGFKIHRIEFYLDEVALDVTTATDTPDFMHMGNLELKINDKREFICPLKSLIGPGYMGFAKVAAGSTSGVTVRGIQDFKHPIMLKGGDAFKVTITSGLTATTASAVDVQVALFGELTTPS